MNTAVSPTTVPAPPAGRFSHAVRVDLGTGAPLFVSGQVVTGDRYLADAPPTSMTVEVSRLFRPEALVEVDVVAAPPAARAEG